MVLMVNILAHSNNSRRVYILGEWLKKKFTQLCQEKIFYSALILKYLFRILISWLREINFMISILLSAFSIFKVGINVAYTVIGDLCNVQ